MTSPTSPSIEPANALTNAPMNGLPMSPSVSPAMSLRTSMAAVVAAGCMIGAVVAVNTQSSTVLGTSTAGAWFANDTADSVSHLGPAGVDATVAIDGSVGALDVVELDGVAFLTDADGTLFRIDPAQLEVSEQIDLPSVRTRLIAGGGRLFSLDDEADTIRELDPDTLASVGSGVPFDGDLGDAVVDPSSTLWFADTASGDVVSFADGAVVDRVDVDAQGPLLLSAVGPRVVALDAARTTATIVTGSAGSTVIDLPIEADDRLDAPDVVDVGTTLPILAAGAKVVLLDLVQGTTRVVALPNPGHEFGTPEITSTRAYVPDFTNGSLIPIGLSGASTEAAIVLSGQPGTFEVVADATAVYASDQTSEQAWAVDDAGGVTVATKYDVTEGADGGVKPVTIPEAPEFGAPSTTLPPEADDSDDSEAETAPTTTTATDRDANRTPPPPSTPPRGGSSRPPNTQPPIVIPVAPPSRPNGPPASTVVPLPSIPSPPTTLEPTPPPATPGPTPPRDPGTPTTTTAPDPSPRATLPPTTTTTLPPVTQPPVTQPPTTLPPPAPNAPQNVSATPGNGQATVSWSTGPGNGATIQSFVVRNITTGATVTASAGATSATVGGLANGSGYQFDVLAVSATGLQSPASAASSVATPFGPPAAPSVNASATSPTDISVSFSAVGSSNGTTVGSWQVSLSPGGASQTVSSGNASFGGLSQNTTYTVSVVAIGTNGLQSGAGSASATTPSGAPGALPSLNVGRNAASWGAAVGATSYIVVVNGAPFTVTSALSVAIGPVFPGDTIEVTVTPTNGFGSGSSLTDYYYAPEIDPCPYPPRGCIPP